MGTTIDMKDQQDTSISALIEKTRDDDAVHSKEKQATDHEGKHDGNMRAASAGQPSASDTFDGHGKTESSKYTGGGMGHDARRQASGGDEEREHGKHAQGHGGDSQARLEQAEQFKVADVIRDQAISGRAIRG